LLAQRDYKAYREQQVDRNVEKDNNKYSETTAKNLSPVKDFDNEDDFKWDSLLAQIDNIQVN
jgi:hypothetical protein